MAEVSDSLPRTAAEVRAVLDHPTPNTPGLRITETDAALMRLWADVRQHQLTWEQLLELPEDQLYWLAGIDVDQAFIGTGSQPAGDDPRKLSANVWRARRAAERRAQDRAVEAQLAFQRGENRRNRRAQVAGIILGALIGATVTLLVNGRGRPSVDQPVRVEAPSSTTTAPPTSAAPTSAPPATGG
jgi:hypothetical protein